MSMLEQKQSLQMHQGMRQFLRIEQSALLEMPQSELSSLISEIEHSKLFDRLFKKEKIIRYNKLNQADISGKFYTLKEDLIADSQSPDVETLLSNKKRVIEYIRKIGLENFKKYFLLPEEGLSNVELANKCNLEISQVKDINALVDDITIMNEFYHPSKVSSIDINYSKIASIGRDKIGFTIGYFSVALAKGRYNIDYEKFEQMEISKGLSYGEIKEAKKLFHKLEMINRCKETLHRILNNIIEIQAGYLDSGDIRTILPLSQKELANKIGISPGTVSRAIKYRTIEIPQGREVILKDFFAGPKKLKITLLKKLLETEAGLLSDAQIQKMLVEKHGVNISRRSVADLRNTLKIPPKNKRRFVRR
ncbi:MAG: winged helix-turn-helix transcriptional regulator [Dehalococcoidales bacterium]|nr:winged helix-turn-helix transcriptional regulator [Dehalococcoidales bacterium]